MRGAPIEVAARRGQPLGMPPARFLRDYWQKRPLLIRGAFPGFAPPLGPEDLAGLACEELALARIVLRDRRRDRWSVRNGPFAESAFAALPESDWTLLVQDVDKWDADVAALRDGFRFLPTWRIDDVMVSYAADGGGVGAHVDQYDVFLLQGLGRRRWAISTDPHAPQDCRDDVELKQLRTFAPTHAWLLEPGDMLYLPPGVPHDGVAIGPCMTLSLGMRAPSRTELLLDAAEHLAERMPEALRYADPGLAPARAAGEIDAAALARAAAALGPLAQAFDRAALADWFGRFITRYRAAQYAAAPARAVGAAQFERALGGGARLLRHPWSRYAWARSGRGATLFVAGRALPCPPALARRLCAPDPLAGDAAELRSRAARAVALDLVNAGHLVLQRPRRKAAP
ncbi:MAG: cupin domain-containing protein [Mizugakiibacter sp.]|uniref:cupin domain-containing protein n=1 Tax=Mizugakiibacter sp. TaxID=1972610 RepID=UPI0031C36844|nr:cupin domain-containing protein [Xanthomonadaceae bacterium]